MSRDTKPLVERAGLAAFWNAAFFPLKTLVALAASIIAIRLLRTEGWALYLIVTSLLNGFGLIVTWARAGLASLLPRGRDALWQRDLALSLGERIKGAVLLGLLLALAVAPDSGYHNSNWASKGVLLMMIGVLLVLGAVSDISIQLLYTHFAEGHQLAGCYRQRGLPVLDPVVYIGWGA